MAEKDTSLGKSIMFDSHLDIVSPCFAHCAARTRSIRSLASLLPLGGPLYCLVFFIITVFGSDARAV